MTASARMQPAGFAEVELAQNDGRWHAAYDSPKDMVVPDDFFEALKANDAAQAWFNGLSKADKYAIAWRLQTAKTPEIRERRFQSLLTTLERNEPLRQTAQTVKSTENI